MPLQPIETASRQRYTNPDVAGGECAPRGQDIERDFATYHETLARIRDAALQGPGVASGLTVTIPAGRSSVSVGPGVGVASSGAIVVLPNAGPALVGDSDVPVAVPAPVPLPSPAPDGEYVLTAVPALVPQDGERCGRMAVAARLRLVIAAAFTPDADAVVLKIVQVAAGKVVTVTNDSPAVPGVAVTRTGVFVLRQQLAALQAQFDTTIAQLQQRIAALEAHAADRNNPHATTAAQTQALPLSGGTLSGNLTLNGDDPTITLSSSLELKVGEGGPQVMLKSNNNMAVALFASGHGGQLTLIGMQGQDGKVFVVGPSGRQRTYDTQRPQ